MSVGEPKQIEGPALFSIGFGGRDVSTILQSRSNVLRRTDEYAIPFM